MKPTDVARIVKRLTRGLRGRVFGMIRRSTLGTLTPTTLLQTIQAKTTKDDVDDGVELFEPYGFTSGPPPNSEGLILRVGAERASSVGILFGSRSTRLQGVLQGEVALYTQGGASIVLRNSGNIEVTPGEGGVVQLGGPAATLAVARQTDPVGPSEAMATWAAAVEAGISGAGGTPPPTPFAPTVVGDFASITTGGEGSTST